MAYTKRQLLILVLAALVNILTGMIYSLQAPFYPKEAERKGVTPSEYGFVFGIYELIVVLSSPIFGRFMDSIRPTFGFKAGGLIAAWACVLFGLLDHIFDATKFLAFSFLIRIFAALGKALFFVSSITIIAYEFEGAVAVTISGMETCFGIGLIIGPTVGGVLYDLGGYILPFVVVGGILLIATIVSALFLPDRKSSTEEDEEEDGEDDSNADSILRKRGVWLGMGSVIACSVTLGFLAATLEPHLRRLALTGTALGAMFVINGGVYGVTAPMWGYLCDNFIHPRLCMFVGPMFMIAGFVLLGPFPGIPIDYPELWMICLGLAFIGLGSGGELISGMIDPLNVAVKEEQRDSVKTFSMITGVWQSSFSFGSFFGPSLGGILLDSIGFRWATLFTVSLHCLLIVVVFKPVIDLFRNGNWRIRKEPEDHEALVAGKPRTLSGMSQRVRRDSFYTYGSGMK